MQPVQQEGEQLLAVVLLVTKKLGGKVAHLCLHDASASRDGQTDKETHTNISLLLREFT